MPGYYPAGEVAGDRLDMRLPRNTPRTRRTFRGRAFYLLAGLGPRSDLSPTAKYTRVLPAGTRRSPPAEGRPPQNIVLSPPLLGPRAPPLTPPPPPSSSFFTPAERRPPPPQHPRPPPPDH